MCNRLPHLQWRSDLLQHQRVLQLSVPAWVPKDGGPVCGYVVHLLPSKTRYHVMAIVFTTTHLVCSWFLDMMLTPYTFQLSNHFVCFSFVKEAISAMLTSIMLKYGIHNFPPRQNYYECFIHLSTVQK